MTINDIDNVEDPDVARAFVTFRALLGLAEQFLKTEKYLQAVACAQIAALYASYNHHGRFVSPQLEELLRTIGNRTINEESRSPPLTRNSGAFKRVLHVLTAAKDVGGDSRFVWRWIQRDSERTQSVALLYQLNFEVPHALSVAVARTGGTVHVLDRSGADVIERAKALRKIAEHADVVFLHVYVEEVVPLIAFANKANLPPIVFVVQADHQFWSGVSVSDLFVHLRESGMRVSADRRGIAQEQMARLPIPLDPVSRKRSRSEAKSMLGFSADTVLLLSIARAIKYMPIKPPDFAEVMVPVLNKHENAVLLVVGPAEDDQWTSAQQKTGGRIRALGQRSDTAIFYEAADIYLDSFPFSSNTSLLEAGSYGLPLVSYFPYSAEADALGPGAPGLEGSLRRTKDLEGYREVISRLIEDKEYRVSVGERTREGIRCMHSGEGWNQCLQKLYHDISAGLVPTTSGEGQNENRSGQLDLLLNRYYSRHVPLGWVIGWYARHLPYGPRLQLLSRMLRIDRSFSFSMFLPKWLGKWLGGHVRGWRCLPGIARWLSTRG